MRKAGLLLFIIVCLQLWSQASAAEIMTDKSILEMVKAGLSNDLIIAKIKNSRNEFDLSTDKILMLKKDGVPESVLKAMVESPSNGTPEQIEQVPVANTMASYLGLPPQYSFNASSLYTKIGDKVSEMPPIIAEIAHSMKKHFIPYYFGSGDNWHFIRGKESVIRIITNKPVFYTRANPSAFILVRLSYQAAKDIRYVISTGSVYKNTIPLKYEKRGDDVFELSPAGDLSPGEYAFVNSMTFYDFGIN